MREMRDESLERYGISQDREHIQEDDTLDEIVHLPLVQDKKTGRDSEHLLGKIRMGS